MKPSECLDIINQASALDPRVLPTDVADRQIKAHMWAKVIEPHITYEQAQATVLHHYANSNDAITPADINGATTEKTPMYLVPLAQRRDTPQVAPPSTAVEPKPGNPCPECGRYYIHDTLITTRGPVCSQAPGLVK